MAYEWNIESNDIKPLESWDNLNSQIDYVHTTPENQNVFDKSQYCLNVRFLTPKPKSKKPNKDLIKAYLSYFTMNKPKVLDALALDFVNSVLCEKYKHKNTLVTGDYDKFYRWKNLFGFGNNSMPLPVFFNDGVRLDKIECYTHEKDEKHIAHLINMFDENTNAMICIHRYLLINHALELTRSYLKKVNQINFPYGGEYYNLEPITDIERVEIIKLLIVHGWHLLNYKLTEKPNIMKNNTNIFYKCLKNTDESRIPLNILHQIYSKFITDGKTDTQLQKELTEAGFKYDLMDIRNKDKEYLDALVEQAKKISLNLEIKTTKSQRSVSCKIDPKFWDEISPEIKKENELTRAAEFELYLKSLSEKYAKFYDVKLPQPEEDPLKDFVPLEKIPDDLLQ